MTDQPTGPDDELCPVSGVARTSCTEHLQCPTTPGQRALAFIADWANDCANDDTFYGFDEIERMARAALAAEKALAALAASGWTAVRIQLDLEQRALAYAALQEAVRGDTETVTIQAPLARYLLDVLALNDPISSGAESRPKSDAAGSSPASGHHIEHAGLGL